LFTADGQNLEALDAKTGKALWHAQIGGTSHPPETFLLDGKQRILATGSAGMYLFVMN